MGPVSAAFLARLNETRIRGFAPPPTGGPLLGRVLVQPFLVWVAVICAPLTRALVGTAFKPATMPLVSSPIFTAFANTLTFVAPPSTPGTFTKVCPAANGPVTVPRVAATPEH